MRPNPFLNLIYASLFFLLCGVAFVLFFSLCLATPFVDNFQWIPNVSCIVLIVAPSVYILFYELVGTFYGYFAFCIHLHTKLNFSRLNLVYNKRAIERFFFNFMCNACIFFSGKRNITSNPSSCSSDHIECSGGMLQSSIMDSWEGIVELQTDAASWPESSASEWTQGR